MGHETICRAFRRKQTREVKELLLSFGGLVLFMIALAIFPPLAIGIMVVGLIGIMFVARDWFDKRSKNHDSRPPTTGEEEE